MSSEKRVLYAGFDASQYSNGQFHHSNNHLNEICAGVFSTIPEDKQYETFSHNRDLSRLELLHSNSRQSFSITLNRLENQKFSENLIYSAPCLLNYFLRSMPLYTFDQIELHFDGHLGIKEKEFIYEQISHLAPEIKIKNYVKHFNQNRIDVSRRVLGKRNSKLTKQPRVVGLADILSNYLFTRHSLGLLLNLSGHKSTRIKLPTSKKEPLEHTHIWSIN